MANYSPKQPEKDSQIPPSKFPLGKINFIMMAACCVIIVLGFILMLGEPSTQNFNPDIFSTRRIVVGPTVCFLGFLLMPVAIMWKGKKK